MTKKGGSSDLAGTPAAIFGYDLGSELQQAVNRGGQVIMVLTMSPDASVVGIIPAKLRPDLDPFRRMPVGPDGDFIIRGLESGAGAFGVAEPFNPVRQVPIAGRVVDENVVEALELRFAQARDSVLPALIRLNDLGKILVPVLLNAELYDSGPIAGTNESLITGKERERQERSLVLLQPVVDLRVVDVRLASFGEERVGAHGDAVDPVQLRGDMPVGLNAGVGAILGVEPLVVVGVEGTVRGHGRFVADDRIHTTGLNIDAAISKDRQVSGQIELAE